MGDDGPLPIWRNLDREFIIWYNSTIAGTHVWGMRNLKTYRPVFWVGKFTKKTARRPAHGPHFPGNPLGGKNTTPGRPPGHFPGGGNRAQISGSVGVGKFTHSAGESTKLRIFLTNGRLVLLRRCVI